ncbi:unnamed protein product [marine sediment metagenome]|uniref:Uncharacterized protein n=1 Tax=marine sediment metagenome TaxID=412755 RepID=X1AKF5_9ZZZZ
MTPNPIQLQEVVKVLEEIRNKTWVRDYEQALSQAIQILKRIDEKKIEQIVSLKLSQMIVEDKPDQRGWTKSMVIAQAILTTLTKGEHD